MRHKSFVFNEQLCCDQTNAILRKYCKLLIINGNMIFGEYFSNRKGIRIRILMA